MEERRSNGFRVKPSFGQVLGYIQEGEPLTLDLPNRKASIYTSSHFYLDDYPNAPEPISETPLPHTSLNPAAAFETADDGYDGVPFPRPPREFTRPSFLPDSSDDGGMDPGQALRNDGLNPPRPPTLGGRLRESGIQAAEAIIAGGAAGAAAATRSVTENQTMLALRGGGDWLDRTLRIPRRPPGLAPAGRSAGTANHRTALGSGATAGEGGATGGGGGTASRPGHRELRFPAAGRSRSIGGRLLPKQRRAAEVATAAEAGGGALAALGEGALATAGAVGAAAGGLAVAGAGAAIVGTAWAIEGGLNAAAHMWGATTGGGTDSDASRPSHATDVQTLNGMQESGAVDHFFAQEQDGDLVDAEGRGLRSGAPHRACSDLLLRLDLGLALGLRGIDPEDLGLLAPPLPCPRAANGSAGSPGATGGLWDPRAQPEASRSRPSTPFVRRANLKLHRYVKQ